jgi:hypothetical protein
MNQKIITVVLCCFSLIFMIPSIALGLGLENPADNAGEPTHFEIVFPELSLQLENNLVNVDFLTADMTTTAKKNYYLSRKEGQTFKLNYNLDFGVAEMTIGDLTLHAGLWGGSSLNLSNGFTKLIFYGYSPNEKYNFNGTLGSALSALSCDLTYARTIPLEINDLQVGATFRLLEGIALYSGEVTDGAITTNEWGQAQYNFKVRSYGTGTENSDFSFSGQGCLVDLGANYVVDKWKFGLALKNLGPPMEWTGIDVRSEQYEGDITEIGQTENTEPTITTDERINSDYSVSIPVVLEAGATYSFTKNLDLKMGLRSAFSDGFGYSRTLRILGDADWTPLPFIHLAGEVYFQGAQMGANTLSELRLGPIWMSLEFGWTGGLIPGNSTSGVNMALLGRLHF